VEARYTSKIGSTVAGRLQRLDVQVGDRVKGGQVLGEMDPVDLDDRVRSQESAFKRVEAVLREAKVRQTYAQTQLHRYQQLFAVRSTSEEIVTTKRQELLIADAAYAVAHEDLSRSQSDRAVLVAQRANQRLISPFDGVVTVRAADPGTTIVAGQAVVEVIDPKSLWINARFDQISASGLAAALPAHIELRSRSGQALSGQVLRVELKADTVTEEVLAKVIFDTKPEALPPVGELAEVTVDLPALPSAPVIPNAAIRREGDKMGVWQIVDGNLHFTLVKLGANDLDGRVQIHEGLNIGDQVVVYSEKALSTRSRIGMVEHIPGVSK
jgi:RND family efflux transporter MFP subunit